MKSRTTILLYVLIALAGLFFFYQPSFAQTKSRIQLKGIITDRETSEPIPYASVGILNKSFGTISDSVGKFNFRIIDENQGDTLQVRLLGYFTTKVLIHDLIRTGERNIMISKKGQAQREFAVPLKNRIRVEGRQDSGQFIQVSLHNQNTIEQTVGSEIGIRIKNKKKGVVLRDFNCYISANNFRFIKFRVNIYSVKRDLPDTLLCSRQIYTTLKDSKTGWISVDLLPYNIIVNGDFVATVQWIDSTIDETQIPLTMMPAVMSVSKNCYFRVTCMDKWQRMAVSPSYYLTLLYD